MDTTSTDPVRCTDPPRPARPAVVRWPVDAGLRDDLARQGVPCLLVVPRGAPIPTVGLGEDWVRDTADEREIAVRLRQLAALGRPAGAAAHDAVEPDGWPIEPVGTTGHVLVPWDVP